MLNIIILPWSIAAGAPLTLTGDSYCVGTDCYIEATEQEPNSERTFVNMRAGASTTSDNYRPIICMEVLPTAELSVEACGTGSGILHDQPGSEVMHLRGKWKLQSWALSQSRLGLHLGIGFAELQQGRDKPGFVFGRPTDLDPVEVAGPEGSLSAQLVVPLPLGFEIISDLSAGLAWFQFAPELAEPMPRAMIFGDISFGFGW